MEKWKLFKVSIPVQATPTAVIKELSPSGFKFAEADQGDLWAHMFKKGIVRLGPRQVYIDREAKLQEISELVQTGKFKPEDHGCLCASKTSGVARFIPVQTYVTTAAYFACVDAYDEACADLAVEGTYGGWSLGGKRKEVEELEVKKLFETPVAQPLLDLFPLIEVPPVGGARPADGGDDDESDDFIGIDVSTSVPTSPYNKAAWFENWQEFWKVLAASTERQPDDALFVSFDVANFYDTVDLRILRCGLEKLPCEDERVLGVLIDLLAKGAPHAEDGACSTTGIPQDMVGDSSRVLANFYLVDFDNYFKEAVEAGGGRFMRWADDITFTCSSEKAIVPLLYGASKKLNSIGLNINAGKVRIRSRDEFNSAWGFDVMDKMLQADHLEEAIAMLRDRWDNPGYERRDTALRSSLRFLRERPEIAARQWIFQNAMAIPGFVARLDFGKMFSLVTISDDPPAAVREITTEIMASPFTQPKCHLLRYLERQRTNKEATYRELYEKVKADMFGSGHPILKLAATYSPYEGQVA